MFLYWIADKLQEVKYMNSNGEPDICTFPINVNFKLYGDKEHTVVMA